jgi:hypothetical protein
MNKLSWYSQPYMAIVAVGEANKTPTGRGNLIMHQE